MARELVPVDESDRFAGTAASGPEDADFTDAGRREILRRFALGAVLAALGAPSWLRAGTRQALATAASTGLVPLSSSGEIKGAYATKSILAIIGVATGIAAAATSAVPVVGVVLGVITAIIGLVGALVGIFWNPSPGQEADTIWNLIKAKVQNLINVSISDAEYAALSGAIDGLKNNMLDYIALVKQHKQLKSAQSLSELRQKYIAVDAFCIGVRPQFLPPGSESRFLVLFAQFANLHHILLQDMVLNGKAYGVEPGLVANDVEKLAQTVAQNCATFDRFWNEFLANCAHSRRDSSMGAAHPAYHGADGAGFPETYYSWIEDTLYDRNRDVNNSIAQVTTLAKDYRDLWPYMGGLKAGPASLTRELWLGPFGEPDCFELGGDFSIIDSAYKVHNGSGHPALSIPWQNTSGYAAAQKPGDSPLAPLRWINVQQLADPPYLAFPSHFTLARVGDNQTPAPGQFWLSLSNADGGPVTGVTVSLTAYFVVVQSSQIPVAGRLVSQINFTKANGSFAAGDTGDGGGIGSWSSSVPVHQDIDASVDDSHILSGMHTNTRVTRLYGGDMYLPDGSEVNIPGGVSAIGSMMFGFRLKDPALAPDTATLAAIHAANPELPPLEPNAAVAIVESVRKAHGQTLSLDEKAALRATFERDMADPALATRSTAFQRAVDDRLAKLKAAGSN